MDDSPDFARDRGPSYSAPCRKPKRSRTRRPSIIVKLEIAPVRVGPRESVVVSELIEEALMRHPDGGAYDGQPCTCTGQCPAVCDGKCGCEACLRAWFDSGLDQLIGEGH